MEMSENELEYQTAVISEVNVWLFQVNEALEKKIRFFFFFFCDIMVEGFITQLCRSLP